MPYVTIKKIPGIAEVNGYVHIMPSWKKVYIYMHFNGCASQVGKIPVLKHSANHLNLFYEQK